MGYGNKEENIRGLSSSIASMWVETKEPNNNLELGTHYIHCLIKMLSMILT